ncbi:collagen alpha-1(V) chain-like [Dipodomys spectabilis]|uniref:collagen alpha-1(V) chain-like n=1 Tax=Dipodomys spectabilis TaxID=105255 RepID=UPI001C54A1FB|nr:collagen alpha-1(V) chain-like [Dipodomys spectabilis]
MQYTDAVISIPTGQLHSGCRPGAAGPPTSQSPDREVGAESPGRTGRGPAQGTPLRAGVSRAAPRRRPGPPSPTARLCQLPRLRHGRPGDRGSERPRASSGPPRGLPSHPRYPALSTPRRLVTCAPSHSGPDPGAHVIPPLARPYARAVLGHYQPRFRFLPAAGFSPGRSGPLHLAPI